MSVAASLWPQRRLKDDSRLPAGDTEVSPSSHSTTEKSDSGCPQNSHSAGQTSGLRVAPPLTVKVKN